MRTPWPWEARHETVEIAGYTWGGMTLSASTPNPRRRRLLRGIVTALVVVLAGLAVRVGPALAQFATITFPDTAAGSTATVKCPDTSVSLCFGSNPACSGSGTVQSVTAPAAPFSAGKFNLLSNSEFLAGNCEAHPVSLPVTLGPGQVLAYQATFAPTAAGTFNGSLTLNTNGGPAVVNLTGKGTGASAGGKGRAVVTFDLNGDTFVPGNLLSIAYQTKPGTLQGKADFYFVLQTPTGEISFLNEAGGMVSAVTPFRKNVTVVEETVTLAVLPVPIGTPFGTYTFYLALGYAGTTPNPANPATLASNLAQAPITYTPLSVAQQTLIQQRGRPDVLTVLWLDLIDQKTESWLYLTNPPTRFRFVNGALQAQEAAADVTPGVGPKFDPAVFTPQLTPSQLHATFGPPTSTETLDGGFAVHHYASGLDVVFQNGVLSSANTFVP